MEFLLYSNYYMGNYDMTCLLIYNECREVLMLIKADMYSYNFNGVIQLNTSL